jgi:hypothetical protein
VRRAQDFLGLVDPAAPAQPLAVFQLELGSFKRPLLARWVAEHVVWVGVRGRWVGQDAVGSGEQLAQLLEGGGVVVVGERGQDQLAGLVGVPAGRPRSSR